MNNLLTNIISSGSYQPSLEDIITRITGAQTIPDILNLQAYLTSSLNKHTEGVLASILQGGQDPLALLDPVTNTLGYLWIL